MIRVLVANNAKDPQWVRVKTDNELRAGALAVQFCERKFCMDGWYVQKTEKIPNYAKTA